jgi:AraC-like DNA-binding protein
VARSTLVTVSNSVVAAIIDGIPVTTAERCDLLASVGLSAETILDVNARTSLTLFSRLWRQVLRVTGNDFIGLTIGAAVRAEQFGLAVQAAQYRAEFRQVLLEFTNYAPLLGNLLACRLDETPPLARFTVRLHWNVFDFERHVADMIFTAILKWAREHLAVPMLVREVRLVHTLASARGEYEQTFAAPVVFGAKRNEIVFDSAILDAAVDCRDQELTRVLESYASRELSRIPIVTDFPSRLAQVVRQRLEEGGHVDVASIASALGIPVRSMQRQLLNHATSYTALLEQVRRSLAPALLTASNGNVEQAGFRLGYSAPTAFIRAFKKWYGVTPGSYRRARALHLRPFIPRSGDGAKSRSIRDAM